MRLRLILMTAVVLATTLILARSAPVGAGFTLLPGGR